MRINIPIALFGLALWLALWGGFIYVLILVIRALRKYLREGKATPEQAARRRSLGEAIKAHRTALNMTQEFVAEQVGVSRQAVSKWESGASDPSTSNLLALAWLFGVSPADLLKDLAP